MKTSLARRHWTHSLQVRIGRTLILLTTGLLAGFGLYQYFELRVEKMAYLNAVADSSIERLARTLAVFLWNFDTLQVESTVLFEMRDRRISTVLLLEPTR